MREVFRIIQWGGKIIRTVEEETDMPTRRERKKGRSYGVIRGALESVANDAATYAAVSSSYTGSSSSSSSCSSDSSSSSSGGGCD
jgi:hypothetical protein